MARVMRVPLAAALCISRQRFTMVVPLLTAAQVELIGHAKVAGPWAQLSHARCSQAHGCP